MTRALKICTITVLLLNAFLFASAANICFKVQPTLTNLQDTFTYWTDIFGEGVAERGDFRANFDYHTKVAVQIEYPDTLLASAAPLTLCPVMNLPNSMATFSLTNGVTGQETVLNKFTFPASANLFPPVDPRMYSFISSVDPTSDPTKFLFRTNVIDFNDLTNVNENMIYIYVAASSISQPGQLPRSAADVDTQTLTMWIGAIGTASEFPQEWIAFMRTLSLFLSPRKFFSVLYQIILHEIFP